MLPPFRSRTRTPVPRARKDAVSAKRKSSSLLLLRDPSRHKPCGRAMIPCTAIT